MNLKTYYLTNNECYKTGRPIKVRGIMVHSTGANNPSLKRYVGPDDGRLGQNQYGNHWNTLRPDGVQICPHAFIGKLKDGTIATYQTLPWTMEGWHSGSGSKGSANRLGYLGFEICEDNLKDSAYFQKVYREAVELCAYLCKQFGLSPKADGVLICHSEGAKREIASNHADVMHWWPKHGKNMDIFRSDVANAMASGSTAPSSTLYRVQCGAYSQRANGEAMAAKLKAAGYQTYLVKVDGLYKVQTGAFSVRANAEKLAKELQTKGFQTYITTKTGTPA